MIEVRDLTVKYGGLTALRNVSLTAPDSSFVTIVGPNGAGKTTFFKTICGIVPPVSGSISFDGENLLAMPPWKRAHIGIAHVPEGRQVFTTMSVRENLELGAYTEAGRARKARWLERIYSLFPVLEKRSGQFAGTLSGGEQQMLAIGRALASDPKCLMLDEPSMGLAPAVADTIFASIHEIYKEEKIAIILVEQRVAESLELCDVGYVLERGSITMSGDYQTLMSDDRIRKSYLGIEM